MWPLVITGTLLVICVGLFIRSRRLKAASLSATIPEPAAQTPDAPSPGTLPKAPSPSLQSLFGKGIHACPQKRANEGRGPQLNGPFGLAGRSRRLDRWLFAWLKVESRFVVICAKQLLYIIRLH